MISMYFWPYCSKPRKQRLKMITAGYPSVQVCFLALESAVVGSYSSVYERTVGAETDPLIHANLG